MSISRRHLLLGTAGTLGAAVLGAPGTLLAATQAIRIGWLAALTGPNSAPGIGFDRGVHFAANAINEKGGAGGRKIEVITRDTQSDPSKAVNATQEMINSLKVDTIWGPTNSGESLAVTKIMARARKPNMHPCVVDSLIDTEKYPNAFRISPSNAQWDDAARNYCLNVLNLKKIAVLGDSTGYGISAVKASTENFKKDGADVVYSTTVDPAQPDLTPNLLQARSAGAEIVVVWSDSVGMNARLFNARTHVGWDVDFVGHPSMSSGEVKGLLEKPENWDRVYAVGYKSASYGEDGKLPDRSEAFVDMMTKGNVKLDDTLYWWVSAGFDAVTLVAKAIEETGSAASDDIIGYWNSLKNYPGYFGDLTWTPTEHNGYPTSEVVMSAANSAKNGTFQLAPGYVAS